MAREEKLKRAIYVHLSSIGVKLLPTFTSALSRSIGLRRCIRTLELEREWGLRPQPGVPPLHLILTTMIITIFCELKTPKITTLTQFQATKLELTDH